MLTAEDLQKLGSFERYARRGRRRHSVIARFPARIIRRLRTSRAAADTTKRRSTASVRTTTRHNMDRLAKKYETAREHVPQPEVEYAEGAKIGFLAFGTTHWAIIESQDQLQREYNMPVSYYRLRAVPFTKHLVEFFEKHDRVYVVEQNRDGQMAIADQAGTAGGTGRQDSQHPALQRTSDRRPLRHRRSCRCRERRKEVMSTTMQPPAARRRTSTGSV